MYNSHRWTSNPPKAEPTSVKRDWEKNTQDIVLNTDDIRHSGDTARETIIDI